MVGINAMSTQRKLERSCSWPNNLEEKYSKLQKQMNGFDEKLNDLNKKICDGLYEKRESYYRDSPPILTNRIKEIYENITNYDYDYENLLCLVKKIKENVCSDYSYNDNLYTMVENLREYGENTNVKIVDVQSEISEVKTEISEVKTEISDLKNAIKELDNMIRYGPLSTVAFEAQSDFAKHSDNF